MRRLFFLVVAVFLLGIGANAQDTQPSYLFTSPFASSIAPPATAIQPATPAAPALSSLRLISSSLDSLNLISSDTAPSSPGSAAAPAPPDPPQDVYGVRPTFPFEAYIGYTFLRFYEVPGTSVSTNGFNYSIVYFPGQLKDWVGLDGEFLLGLGDQFPYQARFLLGLGGVRLRAAPFVGRAIEVWLHGLAGATHFTPQTPYGNQGAFAYEVGGGVDLNMRRSRYAVRIGADMVGTHYFGTYQFNPKISTGFIYKF
jgi:hypothetical protein